MSAWDDLTTELDRWSDRGSVATFWWRDDDAVHYTPALHRLYELSGEYNIPLTLAVIPRAAHEGLCAGDDRPEHLRLIQHGYAHINHAPDHEKKSEFGQHRQADAVADDLSSGFSRIKDFPQFIPAFVPPWNRIAPEHIQALVNSGLQGLSTFSPRQHREPVRGLIQANAHADIINWRGTRGFAGHDFVCSQISEHLIARRVQKCDFEEPTGILTHHLVHDDTCWDFLGTLFELLNGHTVVRWLDGSEVFAA